MSEKTIEALAKLGLGGVAIGALTAICWRALDILSRQTEAIQKIADTYAGK